MRTDILTRFKKDINNVKSIRKWLEKSSEKSFVKFSMLKDILKEAKELENRMISDHEDCKNNSGLYVIKGVEYEYEVRSFYQNKIKYYRWLLDL